MASAGTLGIIIPPSIPLILYGIMTERNIAQLFVAGIGPGLLLTFMFAMYSFAVNRKIGRETYTLQQAWKSFTDGIFALMLPVIIIGGIYSGYFSPTESAAVALAYALLIEFFVHKREKQPERPADTGGLAGVRYFFATRAMNGNGTDRHGAGDHPAAGHAAAAAVHCGQPEHHPGPFGRAQADGRVHGQRHRQPLDADVHDQHPCC